jgi:hypothetical protein
MNIEFGKGEGSWLERFFKNALEFAVGFVPIVGPLLSIVTSLSWTAISDPDQFPDAISMWVPSAKVGLDWMEEMRQSANEMRRLSKESFWRKEKADALTDLVNSNRQAAVGDVSGATVSYFKDTAEQLNCHKATYDKTLAGEPAGSVVRESPAG